MKTNISLIKCKDYNTESVTKAVNKAVELLGGIKKFIKSGEKILIKPNLLSAKPPERAITTHPEVVRAIIKLVKEAGATPVVGDSPGGAIKGVERVWNETGMKKIAQEENIELINFETFGVIETKLNHPTVKSIHLSKIISNVDGIINIPKLKSHGMQTFTCAVKNFYGCIPGLRKGEYHKFAPHPDEFGHLLSEIYLHIKDKVRFHIIDGIIGMEGNGPSSGDIRKLDIIAACDDALALDTFLVHILGFRKGRIEALHYLKKAKAGESEISNMNIMGNNPSEFNLAKFKFPSNWYVRFIPHFLINILGKLIWLKPAIIPDKCTSCMMCVDSCPVKTIYKKDKEKPVVDPKGCISCLCCHELCPYDSIALRKSALVKVLFRHH